MAWRTKHTPLCVQQTAETCCESEGCCSSYFCYGQNECIEEYYVDLEKPHTRVCKGCTEYMMMHLYEEHIAASLQMPVLRFGNDTV